MKPPLFVPSPLHLIVQLSWVKGVFNGNVLGGTRFTFSPGKKSSDLPLNSREKIFGPLLNSREKIEGHSPPP